MAMPWLSAIESAKQVRQLSAVPERRGNRPDFGAEPSLDLADPGLPGKNNQMIASNHSGYP
jgi:hypothetical protein